MVKQMANCARKETMEAYYRVLTACDGEGRISTSSDGGTVRKDEVTWMEDRTNDAREKT
jgi:hypothetical protein